MYRLSLIISEIYNKYLPLAEKDGIILNLDFSDTTKEIADPERVKQYLDEHLNSTLKRSDKGEVTIGVDKSAITITDSATTLSHTACALLSNKYIDVTSRVGFGTTVKIFFQPRELTSTQPTTKPSLKVEGVSVSTSLENTTNQAPTLKSEVKVAAKQGKKKIGLGARLKLKGKKPSNTTTDTAKATKSLSAKSKTKTATKSSTKKLSNPKTKRLQAKTERQLAAAARKADKEVKRIAKKAQKASRQSSKTNKEAKQANKPSQKTNRTIKPAAKSKAKTTNKKIKKIELS